MKIADGRHLFKSWCEDAKMTVSIDKMGTMFAMREGSDSEALPICIGSHLDTQPTGGKFDGVLGVLSGLEIIQSMNDLNIVTKHPIVIVNWTNEEGSRFAPSMLASGVFSGEYTLEYAYQLKDSSGKSFGNELKRIGWQGEQEVGIKHKPIAAYFEYHIEQGPILESKNKLIGIVTHGQGQSWLEITLNGKATHTGSTPMNMRIDAGLAAARIIDAVNKIAMDNQPNVAGSIGQLRFFPNSRNTLPEKVVFTIDIRAANKDKFYEIIRKVKSKIKETTDSLEVEYSMESVGHYEPITFNEELVSAVRNSVKRLEYTSMDITSGAGHDAFWISKVAPATMIMCPCVSGISHSESENIHKNWAVSGANVLFNSVIDIAKITSM